MGLSIISWIFGLKSRTTVMYFSKLSKVKVSKMFQKTNIKKQFSAGFSELNSM